jgi:hypothetical protein
MSADDVLLPRKAAKTAETRVSRKERGVDTWKSTGCGIRGQTPIHKLGSEDRQLAHHLRRDAAKFSMVEQSTNTISGSGETPLPRPKEDKCNLARRE